MTTRIATTKPDNKNEVMLRLALEKGANLSELRDVLALQKEWEANEARKAYYASMAAFKAEAPKILKNKAVGYDAKNGGVRTSYKHATLDHITDRISPVLSKHGLSASWRVAQNGQISVTTRIAHVLGHFEETTITAGADTTGSKNSIQAVGSTITYLQRYGLLALTGLATADQDDDAQAAQAEYVSERELHQLRDHILNEGLAEDRVCQYLKVESLEKLPKSEFKRAMMVKKAVKK